MNKNKVLFTENDSFHLRYGDKKIRLSYFANDDISYQPKKEELNQELLQSVSSWLAENLSLIKEFATEELLDLKNDDWREENEPKLTAEEFIARLELLEIVVYYTGKVDMIFDADDIFYDHCISVYTNENLLVQGANVGY